MSLITKPCPLVPQMNARTFHFVFLCNIPSYEGLRVDKNFQAFYDIKYIASEMTSLDHCKIHIAISELRD